MSTEDAVGNDVAAAAGAAEKDPPDPNLPTTTIDPAATLLENYKGFYDSVSHETIHAKKYIHPPTTHKDLNMDAENIIQIVFSVMAPVAPEGYEQVHFAMPFLYNLLKALKETTSNRSGLCPAFYLSESQREAASRLVKTENLTAHDENRFLTNDETVARLLTSLYIHDVQYKTTKSNESLFCGTIRLHSDIPLYLLRGKNQTKTPLTLWMIDNKVKCSLAGDIPATRRVPVGYMFNTNPRESAATGVTSMLIKEISNKDPEIHLATLATSLSVTHKGRTHICRVFLIQTDVHNQKAAIAAINQLQQFKYREDTTFGDMMFISVKQYESYRISDNIIVAKKPTPPNTAKTTTTTTDNPTTATTTPDNPTTGTKTDSARDTRQTIITIQNDRVANHVLHTIENVGSPSLPIITQGNPTILEYIKNHLVAGNGTKLFINATYCEYEHTITAFSTRQNSIDAEEWILKSTTELARVLNPNDYSVFFLKMHSGNLVDRMADVDPWTPCASRTYITQLNTTISNRSPGGQRLPKTRRTNRETDDNKQIFTISQRPPIGTTKKSSNKNKKNKARNTSNSGRGGRGDSSATTRDTNPAPPPLIINQSGGHSASSLSNNNSPSHTSLTNSNTTFDSSSIIMPSQEIMNTVPENLMPFVASLTNYVHHQLAQAKAAMEEQISRNQTESLQQQEELRTQLLAGQQKAFRDTVEELKIQQIDQQEENKQQLYQELASQKQELATMQETSLNTIMGKLEAMSVRQDQALEAMAITQAQANKPKAAASYHSVAAAASKTPQHTTTAPAKAATTINAMAGKSYTKAAQVKTTVSSKPATTTTSTTTNNKAQIPPPHKTKAVSVLHVPPPKKSTSAAATTKEPSLQKALRSTDKPMDDANNEDDDFTEVKGRPQSMETERIPAVPKRKLESNSPKRSTPINSPARQQGKNNNSSSPSTNRYNALADDQDMTLSNSTETTSTIITSVTTPTKQPAKKQKDAAESAKTNLSPPLPLPETKVDSITEPPSPPR
jgi:hypothetical protein